TTTITAVKDAQDNVVTSVPLGSVVHDTAFVTSSNSTAKPTGSVTFKLFPNGNCTGTSSTPAGTGTLDANGNADSSALGPLAAGSYGFQASYLGDTSFIGSTGDCEPFTVAPSTPVVTTSLHNASTNAAFANGTQLPFGSGVFDVASLANGGSFPFSGGSVTFNFYASVDCAGTPVAQTGVSVSGSDAQSTTHAS